MKILLNIVWFQVCWLACVLFGNKAAVFVFFLILAVYYFNQNLKKEWSLLIGVFFLGLCVDIGLIAAGVLDVSTNNILPPLWLSMLWLAFATTLNHSISPLLNRPVLFVLLSGIAGPLCYQLGVNLTDIEFGYSAWISIIVLGLVWLLTGIAILMIYNYWRRVAYP